MKELTYFKLKNCPYCIRANKYLDELMQEDRYKDIQIRHVDEQVEVEFANSYDYYLVPSFFLEDRKLFEGIMTKDDVRMVLEEVLIK